MADKPKFDPSKKFEEATSKKPAFNPNAEFEVDEKKKSIPSNGSGSPLPSSGGNTFTDKFETAFDQNTTPSVTPTPQAPALPQKNEQGLTPAQQILQSSNELFGNKQEVQDVTALKPTFNQDTEFQAVKNKEGQQVVKRVPVVNQQKSTVQPDKQKYVGTTAKKDSDMNWSEADELVKQEVMKQFIAPIFKSIGILSREVQTSLPVNLYNYYFNDKKLSSTKIDDYAAYQFGKALDWYADFTYPVSDETKQSTAGQTISGVTSLGGYMALGALGVATGAGTVALPAIFGALQNGSQEYDRALNTVRDAQTLDDQSYYEKYGQGSDYQTIITHKNELAQQDAEKVAFDTSLGAAAIGSAEGLPVFAWMKRVDNSTGGLFGKAFQKYLAGESIGTVGTTALKQGAEEALQESATQLFTNMNAIQIYDKTREIMEGVAESGTMGFLLGGTVGGLTRAIQSRLQDPSLSAGDKAILNKSLAELEQKKEAFKDIKDDEVVKAQDDIPVVQELKKQKVELEMDLADRETNPTLKDQISEKIDAIDTQIEESKVSAQQEAVSQAERVGEIANVEEMISNLEAQKEQSTPATQELLQPQIDEAIANLEALKSQSNDTENITGVQSNLREGQEPIQTNINQGGSNQETPTSGNVQENEQEIEKEAKTTEPINKITNEKPTITPTEIATGSNPKGIRQDATENAVDTRPIKKITKQGRKPRNQRKPGKLGQEALALHPNSARDLVMQYFIDGGRIRRSVLENQYGKNANKEFSTRINLLDKESKNTSLDGTADEIMNVMGDERFSSSEIVKALEEVLNDHHHPNGMAKEMVEKYGNANLSEDSEADRKEAEYHRRLYEESTAKNDETDGVDMDNTIGFLETMSNEEIQAYAEGKDKAFDESKEKEADDWMTRDIEDDGSTPWDDMKTTLDKVVSALEKGKIDTKGNLNAFGIVPAIWDAAIDTLILAVKAAKATGDVVKAVNNFIKELKDKGATFDEKEVRASIEKSVGLKPKESIKEEVKTETKTEKKEEPTKETPKKKEKRKFTQQVIKDNPAIEESLGEDVIYYDRLPNSVTLAEANGIIEYLGTDESIKAVKDLNNGMTWATRNTIGQVLLKKLQADGEYDTAIDLLEDITTKATELGQGIQAFAMFSALTPEGQLRKTQREVSKQRKEKEKKEKKTTDKLDKGLRAINKETVQEVVDKVVHKIEKTDAIAPKENTTSKEYGTKNKVVTKKRYEELKKALKGKFFSNIPPELIEIAAYHVEASGRKFSEFAKAMVKDFGDKVKPYLKNLYNKSKDKLKDQYDDFSTEAEIDEGYDKVVSKSVKEAMKDGKVDVAEIITKHYTVYDSTKKTLAQKLVDDAGLSGQEAQDLAQAVEREFDKIANAKKKQLFDRIFSKKERATPKVKSLEDDIIKMTNAGAFNNQELIDKYGEKMGWPKLTPENIKEITRLAEIVQTSPEGFKRYNATEDLLKYQASLKGLSKLEIAVSIWYANMLSGHKTQVINFASNMMNAIGEYAVAVAQNPKQGKILAQAYWRGIQRGRLEGKATFQTGYSPIRGKVEVPATLERATFMGGKLNPASYLKYVRRAMVAIDVVMFEGLKEMRAYQWALKLAHDVDNLDPNTSQKQKAMDYVGNNDITVENAQNQAELEYQSEVEQINAEPISQKEKDKKIKEAQFNKKRRVYELVEETRDTELFEESRSFGARGTFNYPPEGLLGWAAEMLNAGSNKFPPMKLVVPFTNIIANVFNNTMNWTPLGFARAYGEGGTITGKLINDSFKRKDWDSMSPERQQQAKVDLMTRAIFGTTMMTALYLMSKAWNDEDEPLVEVTANGTGDYRKNYELQETGWHPYSIKVGGKWYSYQYSPLMVAFSLIGNLNDYEKYRKEKITDEGIITKLGAAATLTSRSALDMTFLSSLNGFLSTVAGSNKEDISEDAIKSALNIGKAFAIPNLYTQTAKDIQRVFDIPTKEVGTTLMGNFLRDIPVARNRYFDKINVLGQPIVPDTDKLWSDDKDSPLFQLIADNKAWIGAPSIRKTTIYDDKLGKERLLTLEEFYKFSMARGEYIRKYLDEHYKELVKMKPEEVQEILTKIKTKATKIAKKELQ